MKKEDKSQVVASLVENLENNSHFYLTDIEALTAETTSALRRKCFEKNITLRVVKNTMLKLAMEKYEGADFTPFYDILKGSTAVMFSEVGSDPAKLIQEFRKTSEKPVLKGAYVEEGAFIGDDQLSTLASIKSKDELIGEIIGLLQSPAKNVVSALQSGGGKLHGILETLSEKG